jgi:hypothetical protein
MRDWHVTKDFLCVCVCVCGIGVWTRVFMLVKQALYCLSQSLVHLALVILEMESHELCIQAGFKLRSTQFQPP